MKKLSGSVLFIIVVLLAATLLQRESFGAVKGGVGSKEAGLIWRLDLTKEQKENISAKETAVRQEIVQLRQSIRDFRISLNAELSADQQDEPKINGLIDNISLKMADIQKQEVFFMLWMREQLTPEQKQKLFSLIKERGERGPGSPEAGGI